jgi:hypothetical protein
MQRDLNEIGLLTIEASIVGQLGMCGKHEQHKPGCRVSSLDKAFQLIRTVFDRG